ncbi:uncharacterized protein TNCV_59001 [Trichonephila clavipes]|nr:uncharacterized protein TNCV_59001 [Trichonephila clavipes]
MSRFKLARSQVCANANINRETPPNVSSIHGKLDGLFSKDRISFGETIELREDLKSRRGLAVSLEIICHNCGESTSTMSSKISNKCYDVNLGLTYGMRPIGKGGAAARIFCGLMNLPPPPAKFEIILCF